MAAAAGVLVTVAVVEVVIQLNRRDAQTACATLCKVCDARSSIYLLGSERLQQAVSAHARHRPRASG